MRTEDVLGAPLPKATARSQVQEPPGAAILFATFDFLNFVGMESIIETDLTYF